MKFFSKKKAVAAAVGMIITATAVGAYAYWSQGGNGSGQATVGDTTAVTVNQGVTITGLYPDGPAVALSGTLTHTNPDPVYVANVTATVADPTGNCAPADFAIEGSAPVNAEVTSGRAWSGLTIRMVDDGTNQDDCKNAALTINYLANAS